MGFKRFLFIEIIKKKFFNDFQIAKLKGIINWLPFPFNSTLPINPFKGTHTHTYCRTSLKNKILNKCILSLFKLILYNALHYIQPILINKQQDINQLQINFNLLLCVCKREVLLFEKNVQKSTQKCSIFCYKKKVYHDTHFISFDCLPLNFEVENLYLNWSLICSKICINFCKLKFPIKKKFLVFFWKCK